MVKKKKQKKLISLFLKMFLDYFLMHYFYRISN